MILKAEVSISMHDDTLFQPEYNIDLLDFVLRESNHRHIIQVDMEIY